MKKLVYALAGGDMECPEFFRAFEQAVEGEDIEDILVKWCEMNDLDIKGKWYNDKFNIIDKVNIGDCVSYRCYGREIIFEDIEQ